MLLRFDPLRDFDRLAQQVLGDWQAARPVPMDVYRSGDHYVIHVDLPGVDAESIDLTVEDDTLTIRASRPQRATEDVELVVAERPAGEFARRLMLGGGLDLGRIAATYDAGVLTVTIPVAETAKPRRIAVGTRVVEGETSEPQAVGA